MVPIQNGSYHKAYSTVYMIPLILLLLLLSSEIVSARVNPDIPISKVKSMPHGNNMEINEVKNQVIGRLLLQTLPPRRDRKGVVRPPTPSGGQG